jgi:hypothetical protein
MASIRAYMGILIGMISYVFYMAFDVALQTE